MNNFFSDAFYFCFVALCTIGFGGDWVRLSSDTGIWLIVIYIFLGVTLLSTTLHIVHQVIISEISNIYVPSLPLISKNIINCDICDIIYIIFRMRVSICNVIMDLERRNKRQEVKLVVT